MKIIALFALLLSGCTIYTFPPNYGAIREPYYAPVVNQSKPKVIKRTITRTTRIVPASQLPQGVNR